MVLLPLIPSPRPSIFFVNRKRHIVLDHEWPLKTDLVPKAARIKKHKRETGWYFLPMNRVFCRCQSEVGIQERFCCMLLL